MFASIAWLLLLSPFDIVEASIDRSVFPKGHDNWDRIGLYVLKEGDKDRLVLLYYFYCNRFFLGAPADPLGIGRRGGNLLVLWYQA